jgi:hypothetical protein
LICTSPAQAAVSETQLNTQVTAASPVFIDFDGDSETEVGFELQDFGLAGYFFQTVSGTNTETSDNPVIAATPVPAVYVDIPVDTFGQPSSNKAPIPLGFSAEVSQATVLPTANGTDDGDPTNPFGDNQRIGNADIYSNFFGTASGGFIGLGDASENFIGLAFETDATDDGSDPDNFFYGYVGLTIDDPGSGLPTFTITRYGYETQVNTATSTPVPEPASAAVLLAGAGLILARRRRA